MFGKNTDISRFVNLYVKIGDAIGRIEGSFGKSGKFRVRGDNLTISEVILEFKKYMFDRSNRLIQ